jgi:hypothetical protein
MELELGRATGDAVREVCGLAFEAAIAVLRSY